MKQRRNDTQGRRTASHWKAAALAAALTMTLLPLASTVNADPLNDALNAVNDAACEQAAITDLACAPEGRLAWAARHDGGEGRAHEMTVSPDGTRVFVVGGSHGLSHSNDYVIVAHDTETGATLWNATYNGPGDDEDRVSAVAVSPDGSKVFVTGVSAAIPFGDYDYLTIAFDAATGEQLWLARHDGPGSDSWFAGDYAYALAVSPDGEHVYVTGSASGGGFRNVLNTVAYDADTGNEEWAVHHADIRSGGSVISVSPDGSRLYVVGGITLLAYEAASGNVLSVNAHDRSDISGVTALAMSADGARVYLTGTAPDGDYSADFATVAHDATTGNTLWTAHYDGPARGWDNANAITVSPYGSRVYVTGESAGDSADYATIAYDTATGAEAWTARYDGPGEYRDSAEDIAVTPDGNAIIVTGSSSSDTFDYTTLQYTADGTLTWESRYDRAGDTDRAVALSMSPDGSRAYVTGTSRDGDNGYEYVTLAYETKASIEVPL